MTYYSESQKKASRKYNEKNYKRIGLYLKPEEKEEWEIEAESKHMNLSEFIKLCVKEYMKK